MTVIEEVLLEEYERSRRICAALEAEVASLPRGSIRTKQIGSRLYYYLQYRDGNRVFSEYVKAEELENLKLKLAKRKNHLASLKEQRRTQKQIEKALGKEFINEHSGA